MVGPSHFAAGRTRRITLQMNDLFVDRVAEDLRTVTFSGFFSDRALKVHCTGAERAVMPKALNPCIIRPKLSPKQQG
jgi:hypothetical protein